MTRVLHVATNVGQFADETPTGLWLSELTHVYDQLAEAGVDQVIASPAGGRVPLEPRSLKPVIADRKTLARLDDEGFMHLLQNTPAVADLDWHDFDAIYLTGGHGVMYDFPDNAGMARMIRDLHDNGRIVSSVCHGYCGFLGVTVDGDQPFVNGRHLTGFSWNEEIAAMVAKKVPYNVQQRMVDLGANYDKAAVPMVPHLVEDGNLITGQNPTSAKAVGKRLVERLAG